MKRSISIIAVLLITFPFLLPAQGIRQNERTMLALRGGLTVGANLSVYTGEAPVRPAADNTLFATGHGSNITIGGFFEKPFSRAILFGASLLYEPMSGSLDATFTEPFRISDANGEVYSIVRNHKVDYSLYYLTLAGYVKLYPVKNAGVFFSTGLHLSALMKDLYYYDAATIKQPEQFLGATYTEGNHVSDGSAIRTSLDFGIGYEIYTPYAFISPSVHYDYGLSKVIDTSWSDNWGINNFRLLLSVSLPIITL